MPRATPHPLDLSYQLHGLLRPGAQVIAYRERYGDVPVHALPTASACARDEHLSNGRSLPCVALNRIAQGLAIERQ